MRRPGVLVGWAALAVALGTTCFHLYTAYDAGVNVQLQRVTHVFALFLLAALSWLKDGLSKARFAFPLLLTLLTLLCGAFFIWSARPAVVMRQGIYGLSAWEEVFSLLLLVLVPVYAARLVGMPLALLALFFLAFALAGPYLPEAVAHKGYSLFYTGGYLAWTLEGIFGVPVGASVAYVSLYIIFGELMEAFGTGRFFIDLAYAATGRMRGGPAEAAVLSSAMMGSINGSAVANVVTTGSFTIPLMKRAGYEPAFAAAVEAAASTGGQILPPVMGAAAFVMADMTGAPYGTIIIAAAVPGLLYYFSLALQVWLRAGRLGLKGERGADLPHVAKVLKSGWPHLIPLLFLVWLLLFKGYSAGYAALLACGALGVVGSLKILLEEGRFPWREFLRAGAKAAHTAVPVAAACASAGIIIGIVSMTGLGVRFTGLALALAGHSTLLMLLLVMCASLILGMGLPSTAAYVIVAAVGAPPLLKSGLGLLPSHMFVFYFAVLSFITPPVGLASYAAAGLARTPPLAVGRQAFALGLSGFLIPYAYAFRPALLLVGAGLAEAAAAAAATVVGIIMLSIALEGWFLKRLAPLPRILLALGALALILPIEKIYN